MTENKTGDFAQNLTESGTVNTLPLGIKQTSESGFKSAVNKIISQVNTTQIREQTVPSSVSCP